MTDKSDFKIIKQKRGRDFLFPEYQFYIDSHTTKNSYWQNENIRCEGYDTLKCVSQHVCSFLKSFLDVTPSIKSIHVGSITIKAETQTIKIESIKIDKVRPKEERGTEITGSSEGAPTVQDLSGAPPQPQGLYRGEATQFRDKATQPRDKATQPRDKAAQPRDKATQSRGKATQSRGKATQSRGKATQSRGIATALQIKDEQDNTNVTRIQKPVLRLLFDKTSTSTLTTSSPRVPPEPQRQAKTRRFTRSSLSARGRKSTGNPY